MDRLQPCPFCGGEATVCDVETHGMKTPWKYVLCKDCEAQISWQNTEAEAIASWNQRLQQASPAFRFVPIGYVNQNKGVFLRNHDIDEPDAEFEPVYVSIAAKQDAP
jgi:Lar family restriction alleviation protein